MIEKDGDGLRVTVPMLIGNALGLLEGGRGFLNEAPAGGTWLIDLSLVMETDSSALSVIFGWLRTAHTRGLTLRIANLPANMVSQAALYGVSESLPLA